MASQVWDGLLLEEGLTNKQLEGLKQVLGDKELWKKSARVDPDFWIFEGYGCK